MATTRERGQRKVDPQESAAIMLHSFVDRFVAKIQLIASQSDRMTVTIRDMI